MFQHREKIRRARKAQEARANAAKAAAEAAAGEEPFASGGGAPPFGKPFVNPNDYASLLNNPLFLEALQVLFLCNLGLLYLCATSLKVCISKLSKTPEPNGIILFFLLNSRLCLNISSDKSHPHTRCTKFG